MGEEVQPQDYEVQVRVRGTLELVKKVTCRVEEIAPVWELDEF
jgi:hypothetical protein